jgi:hypothetical protein
MTRYSSGMLAAAEFKKIKKSARPIGWLNAEPGPGKQAVRLLKYL